MAGVKIKEQKRKPQNPIRRFRPAIPATRHNAKYPSANSRPMGI